MGKADGTVPISKTTSSWAVVKPVGSMQIKKEGKRLTHTNAIKRNVLQTFILHSRTKGFRDIFATARAVHFWTMAKVSSPAERCDIFQSSYTHARIRTIGGHILYWRGKSYIPSATFSLFQLPQHLQQMFHNVQPRSCGAVSMVLITKQRCWGYESRSCVTTPLWFRSGTLKNRTWIYFIFRFHGHRV